MQSVASPLASQVVPSQAAEFPVNEREQFGQRLLGATLDLGQ